MSRLRKNITPVREGLCHSQKTGKPSRNHLEDDNERNAVKMLRVLCMAALAALAAGCETTARNVSAHDKFDNVTINSMKGNGIPPDWGEYGFLYVAPSQLINSNGVKSYMIQVWLDGGDPEAAEPGESLIILADAERLGFELGDSKRVVHHRTLDMLASGLSGERYRGESRFIAAYPAPEEAIRKIGNAKTVDIKWKHSGGANERKFAAANIENFRRFVAQYIDGDGTPPAEPARPSAVTRGAR